MWATAGLLLGVLHGHQNWSLNARWPWWLSLSVLAMLFACTEVFAVHLRIRADAHSFSLTELPLGLGLIFAPPWILIAAQLLGAGSALAVHRKQGPLKLLFNTGVFAITTVTAIGVFHALVSTWQPFRPAIVLAAILALLVEAALATLLVFAVISISAGSWRLVDLRSGMTFGMLTATFTTSLAGIASIVVASSPGLAWLLLVPITGTYLANWAYTTQRRRNEGLDFLNHATQLLNRSTELDEALIELLCHACETFNVAVAEIVYLPDPEKDAVCVRVEHGSFVAASAASAERSALALDVVAPGKARLLRPEVAPEDTRLLAALDFRNAVLAPMRGEHRMLGALIVADRLSQVVDFDANDVRLADTLAGQTAVALENGRLEQSLEQLRILEARLTEQALHDPLSGLANRTLFRDSLRALIELHGGMRGAVLFIDLDDFKTVNDSFGHAVGDALLVEVANRLRRCVSDPDLTARLGGDEFAVLLTGSDGDDGSATALRILSELEQPARVQGYELEIRASVGIARIDPKSDPEAIMRNADTAMYVAKAEGKHRAVEFESSMFESNIERFNLQSEIARALTSAQFVAWFQPIVKLAEPALVGAEALVRWKHPTRGVLAPDDFLGVAEQTGLIVEIDRSILDQACAWLARVDVRYPGLVPSVSVNLSPRHFKDHEIVAVVRAALERHALTPDRLCIEVTENLMSDRADEATEVLTLLDELGVSLSLDDFGTGYSSLSYLQSFPVDNIKIAKAFIDDLDTSPSQRAFAKAIMALADALEKTVIAEGVERPEQLELLRGFGCSAGQGYYFGRPMEETTFLTWAQRFANTEPFVYQYEQRVSML